MGGGKITTPFSWAGLVFVAFYLAFHVAPRNPLSPLGIEIGVPPQLVLAAFSLTVIAGFFWKSGPRIFVRGNVVNLLALGSGSLGLAWVTFHSYLVTGLSRETQDLMGLSLVVPLGFLLGWSAPKIPLSAWSGLLGAFGLALIYAYFGESPMGSRLTFHSFNSIDFAAMMAVASLVSLSLVPRLNRIFGVFLCLVFFSGLVMAGSRGAMASFIISVLVFILLQRWSWVKAVAASAGVAVAAVGVFLFAGLLQSARAGFDTPGVPTLLFRTGSYGRGDLWASSLGKFSTFGELLVGTGDANILVGGEKFHPHNLLLLLGTAGGVLSLATIAFFLFWVFSRYTFTLQAPGQEERVLLSISVYWMVHLQFAGNFGETAHLFLVSAFLAGRLAQREYRLAGSAPSRPSD